MVYFIQCQNADGYIKIGHTMMHVPDMTKAHAGCKTLRRHSSLLMTPYDALMTRISSLQVSCPYPLKALGVTSGDPCEERSLHARFSHLSVRGEWFKPAPELMEFIRDCTYLPR
jgi:hypothetical protein